MSCVIPPERGLTLPVGTAAITPPRSHRGTCAECEPLVHLHRPHPHTPPKTGSRETEDAAAGLLGRRKWMLRGSRCSGNTRLHGEVLLAGEKRGDQRKSCQQWLNKLEREIIWMRARPAPAVLSARKAGSHREKCVGWWETRVVAGWWQGWRGQMIKTLWTIEWIEGSFFCLFF